MLEKNAAHVVYSNDPEHLPWESYAMCAQIDPELHFPKKRNPATAAKKVCAICEVRLDCLEYALANDEQFGIWGGLSRKEREKVKKEREEQARTQE